MNDPIVEEVRNTRASIAAEFGYDRARYLAWARQQTKERKALAENNKRTLKWVATV